jgi:heat shock protein HslJ
VTPKKAGIFGITFASDGTFSVSTDCNQAGGSYTSTKTTLDFSEMFSTMMYCEEAQEAIFTSLLSEVDTYHFTGKGELILSLKSAGGTMTLR